jgi:predicted metalloprotease
MRYDDFRRSDNVEDDRESGGGGGFDIPGGIGGGGGLGIGTIVVLGLLGWAFGIDPGVLIGGAEILTGGQQRYERQIEQRAPTQQGAPKDASGDFVAAVLGDTEDTWSAIFKESGQQYRPPKLRLFRGSIQGGCGMAQSAMGPFYCPNDRRIYIDTSFFQQIEQRFRSCSGKACQFSQAYVLAHEVGHHVQNQLGILGKARQAQEAAGGGRSPQSNQIQVRVELQADCFAGVWANRSNQRRNFIDPGDIEAALQTASAIGDDTLQRQAQGRVVPDSFTHGSAAQRKQWFSTGFQSGKVSACNTFGSPST